MDATFVEVKKQTVATIKSADAAKASVDIAQKTFENNERSFRLQQRPYVIVAGVDLDSPPLKEGENKMTATLRNAGRTPGFETEVISSVVLYGAKIMPTPQPERSRSIIGDSGEAERSFRKEAERHSEMIPNTIAV